jgi:hypothetical protein
MVHRASRVPFALLVAALVAAPAPPSSITCAQARLGSTCKPDGSTCKPDAALDVSFEITRVQGEYVEVDFSVVPRLPLRDVAWELELRGTVSLVDGAPTGRAADGTSTGRLTLRVPADGTHKTAELVVHGVMDGAGRDGSRFDEPMATTRVLEWERPASFLPRVMRFDPETGGSVLADRVPSVWTPVPSRGAATSVGPVALDDGSFLVTGTFLYEDKAWGWKGWTGADPLLPIRRADVTVLDDATGAVLGQGSTGQDGSFAVSCAVTGAVDLLAMCESDTSHDAGFQRLTVTPHSGVDYVLLGPVFPGHDGVSDLDVGTATAMKVTIAFKEGNPFNIFDMAVYSWEWLLGPEVQAGFTPPASGPQPVRCIWPSGGGSFAHSWGPWIGDDDGYDDAVILHELGHVANFQYSDVDSLGAAHTFGQSDQDPRTSLSEGFATCFAGIVFGHMGQRPRYVDSKGHTQLNGWSLRLDMETVAPYANSARGSADETAVCCALYDLLDDVDTPDATPGWDDDLFDGSLLVDGKSPVAAFWDLFTGPMAEAFVLTHNDTWDGWVELYGDDPQIDTLQDLFADYGQFFFEDAFEPDGEPGLATLLPHSAPSSWNGPLTFFSAPSGALAPGSGDEDWFEHSLVKGSVVTFVTRYPGGAADAETQANPRLELYAPDGSLVASDDDSGTGRNARILSFLVPESGAWRVRVNVQLDGWPLPIDDFLRRYGTYEYRAVALFENHLPGITQGPDALPSSLHAGERALLSAGAEDVDAGQALEYEWRPLDGGVIHGTGPSVVFVPPAVHDNTRMGIQLVVRDELGAVSAPQIVEVLVYPGKPAPRQTVSR